MILGPCNFLAFIFSITGAVSSSFTTGVTFISSAFCSTGASFLVFSATGSTGVSVSVALSVSFLLPFWQIS
jgi:hypothetical protein